VAQPGLDQADQRDLAERPTARYDGSLTTAPFTEGVQWFPTTPKTAPPATITRFRAQFPAGNARETQPLNGRTVAVRPMRASAG
jgi:carbonic anhydrase